MKKILTFEMGAVAFAVVASLILAFSLPDAKANQTQICFNYLNGTATTSKTYINSGGTGTTTQTVTNCSDGQTGLDGGAVLLSIISSTTPPSITVRYEVSRDGIDFYPWPFILGGTAGDNGLTLATTTTQVMLTTANDYTFLAMASSTNMNGTGIASSTAGTAITLRGATFNQTLLLPATPFPYFRLKYYVPVGGAAISFSAEVLVNRQQLAR